jgi:hypothetical protein
MGGLRLDQRQNLLKGGKSGVPAIVAGKSAESLLVRYISGLDPKLVMPPTGERLSAGEISRIACGSIRAQCGPMRRRLQNQFTLLPQTTGHLRESRVRLFRPSKTPAGYAIPSIILYWRSSKPRTGPLRSPLNHGLC